MKLLYGAGLRLLEALMLRVKLHRHRVIRQLQRTTGVWRRRGGAMARALTLCSVG